jgi:omega-amidase
MSQFKISLIQMKVTFDKLLNLKNAKEMIHMAITKNNSQVVVLPEYFNTPYQLDSTPKYAETEDNSQTLEFLSKTAKTYKINLIGGSIPIKDGDKYYNTSYCFDPSGNIAARHRKVHLFDIDIPGGISFQESKMLSPGNQFTVFKTDYCKIGIGICYDVRFPEYAHILKKDYGVEMIVYPAAFNTTTGPMHWDLLQRARALDNNVYVAMCSPARNTGDKSISYNVYGYSGITDPFGDIMIQTGEDEAIVTSDIDLKRINDISQQIPTWKQKRNDLYEISKKI